MRNILFSCLVFISIICSSQTTKKALAAHKADTNIKVKGWQYEIDTDQMTSKLYYVATLHAPDKVYLKFPYNGGSDASIYVRNKDGANSVWFSVSRGFIGHLGAKSVDVRIRFDEEQPKYYTFYFAEDRIKDQIGIEGETAEEIIGKLKKAKKVKIELEFLSVGSQIINFDAGALKWDHKNKKVIDSSSVKNEKPTWIYSTDTDKMTSDVYSFARLEAIEKLFFKYPYDGGSTPFLFLQNYRGINYFAFRVDKGSFNLTPSGAINLRIRFDEEQPKYYTFYCPNNEDARTAVIRYGVGNEMIEKLKKAKRVRIEADFDKGGDEIVEFYPSGLKWNYKGKEDDTTGLKGSVGANTVQSNWHYSSDTSKMTSHITYSAYTIATEKLNFKVPYSGGSVVRLGIGNVEGTNLILLIVNPSQFSRTAKGVKVRFDKEEPEYYPTLPPEIGRANQINILNESKFIEKLKKAKKILIEADFYDDGSRIMEFNVAGLKWEYEDNPAFENGELKSAAASPYAVKVNVSSTTISSSDNSTKAKVDSLLSVFKTNGNGTTNEISINGAVIDTREVIDESTHTVKLHCIYKNNNNADNSITIKAYFMDENKNVLDTKSILLSCSANSEVSTDIKYNNDKGKYKSYRIEIE